MVHAGYWQVASLKPLSDEFTKSDQYIAYCYSLPNALFDWTFKNDNNEIAWAIFLADGGYGVQPRIWQAGRRALVGKSLCVSAANEMPSHHSHWPGPH